MGYLLCALLAAALLAGCYVSSLPRLTLHPSVFVDDTFTPDEHAGILAGLALWETAGVGVAFTVSTMARAEVLRASLTTENVNAIYIVRNEGDADASCPLTSGVGEGHLGGTRRIIPADGIEIVCLNAPALTRLDAWPVAVGHEIGHAFGLEHETSGAPALMAPTLETASHRVEDADRAQLLRVWAGR